MFVDALDFSFDLSEDGLSMSGSAFVSDHLRSPGSSLARPSVLATIADCVTGAPACMTIAPRLAVTLDIVVHTVVSEMNDRLRLHAQIVKQGRSTIATTVRFCDETSGELVAWSYLTFMASPRPQDIAPLISAGMRTRGSMPKPFAEYVGVNVLAPGVAEVALSPFVEQASGSLQGGIVALAGEIAAESLLSRPVIDLDIRYLSAVRVGPGRAVAVALNDQLVAVEVRDVGRDDRLAALVTARLAPPGHPAGERGYPTAHR